VDIDRAETDLDRKGDEEDTGQSRDRAETERRQRETVQSVLGTPGC
jgi:hypothetical protein